MTNAVKFTLLIVVWFSSIFCGAVAFSAELKSLKVAVGDSIVPYQFRDKNGELQGYVIDFWRLWQEKTGIEVEFVPSSWPKTLENTIAGVADVHGAIAFNDSRAKDFFFGDTIYSTAFSIYVHRDLVGIRSVNELTPYVVGVLRNTAYRDILLNQNTGLSFREYDSREEFLTGVQAGEVKAFVSFDFLAFQYTGHGELHQLFPPYKRINIGDIDALFAVPKSTPELIPVINAGIGLISQQEIAEIERRWFGVTSTTDSLLLSVTTGAEPYMGMSPSGEASGLMVDIWKLWAEKTATDVVFIPNSMSLARQAVEQGKADVHIAYPESETMGDGLNRARHIYSVYSNLFVNEEFDPALGLAQLSGKKVGLFQNAPYKDAFKQRFPDVQVLLFNSMDEALDAAIQGKVIGFIASNQMTFLRALQNNVSHLIRPVEGVRYEAKLFAIVATNNEMLANKINKGFDLITQEEFLKIEKRWIHHEGAWYFSERRNAINFTEREQAWLTATPQLSVGVVKDWKPYEFLDHENQLKGLSIDIFNLAAEMTGQSYDFNVYDSWELLINDFESGSLDMVANISPSPTRQSYAYFTESYWHTPWSITTHKSQGNIDSILRFSGKSIAILDEYQIIQDLEDQYPQVNVVVADDYEEAIRMLKAGLVDGVLDNMLVSAQYIQDNELYQFKMHVIEDLPFDSSHMGIRKELPTQLEIMNKVVAAITESDNQQLLDKWNKVDVVQGVSSKVYLRNIFTAILIASAIVGVVLLWNNRLMKEVNKRRAAEKKLKHMASHDHLTGLANRALFVDRVQQAISNHHRHKRILALFFFDLDGFKQVNDTHGHEVGDQLLLTVAKRLQNKARESDTVARFGGDEFVMMVTDLKDKDAIDIVANKLLQEFEEQFTLEEVSVSVGVSIGIACYPEHGDDVKALMQKADDAMYQVKQQGKNGYLIAD